MTDTGQGPEEGQPESAGMAEPPGAGAHGAYAYLSEAPAEDEDLLLPGAQGAWGNEVPPPAPEPVVEAVHQPGPHETAGRDSGSVDLSGVRLPDPGPVSVPPSPILSTPHDATAAAQQPPRRPLHLGPPIPNASAGPVRSLADRGPAGAPVQRLHAVTAPAAPAAAPVPAQPDGWAAPVAETVDPAVPAFPASSPASSPSPSSDTGTADVAQATLTRLATQAAPTPQGVHGHDGMQSVHGHDGVYVPEPADAGEAGTGEAGTGEAGTGEVPEPPASVEPAGVVEPGRVAEEGVAEPVEGVAPEAVDPEAVAPEAFAPEAFAPEAVGPVAEAVVPQIPEEGTPEQPGAEAGGVPEAVAAPEVTETPAAVPAPEPAPVVDAVAVPEDVPVPEEVPVSEAELTREEAPLTEAVPVPGAAPIHEAAPAAEVAPVAEGAPAPDVPPASEAVRVEAQPEPVLPEPVAAEPVGTAPVVAEAAVPAEPTPAVDQAPEGAPEPLPTAADSALDALLAEAAEPAAEAPDPARRTAVAEPEPLAAEPEPLPAEAPAPAPEPAPGAETLAVHPADTAPRAATVPAPAGPQIRAVLPEAPAPQAPVPAAVEPEPYPEPVGPLADPVPHVVPDAPLGQFVPVEGQVPTTPHLAPTPPQPLVLPVLDVPEQVPTVPAPRDAESARAALQDAVPAQSADDLETRAADQEDAEEAAPPADEARRSTGPAAPGYDDAERAAVLKVMRERRDIRNGFRDDPIPHEVLLRVLEAAHTAPSVGHSQPWDFVVIRSAETRRAMHELAVRQRDAYAKSLPKGRAKQFKELKIEAILDTPVNIVVTADPTRGGRHTLGRHTQPQMAPYSSALAVENLWLAARAEGLGVGWVSFFDEREMVRALGLPEHLEVVAYLCVGYVDEFPEEPELMQAGWSKRRPLSWVVHEETYGRRALPGEEPHDLLAETVAQIRPLDAKALGEAWERQKRMTKPAGALGMLEIISAQLAGLSRQCPPPIPEPAAVAVFAGDHGVHAQGVTPWPQEVTAQMVANFLGGGAVCNAFAAQVGAEVCVVDVGVAAELPSTPGLLPRKIRGGTSDMTTGPAMTREEAKAAVEVGIETARDLVAAGNKALLTGEMGIANTTASAALISVFTGADPAEVTGRGTGINDETLARKTEVVRRALDVHRPDPADPLGVLAAVGGFEHAALVGLLLGGASLRTPVILDGVSAGAAALVARAIAPEVLAACIAGHRSAEPGHVAALNKLGLRPLVDLDLRLGEGTGALLALPLVQSTARAMHEVATFDSAGVTEK
ncbi:nicotinate-nucleotide--dimethylbenzimidazole phosphoribosyltransferase [Streptomyces sp. J2-1]|uniref:nicotinate-nucleotide--dimethylbenzimidazole phosphoribosyltransferase n=1 Tax=Streptomyces corallincola TaxID=2851888 RepID=UPI001C3925E5|nr:nicotinate-nucleotide--dimethylbenzimidazole phosphoribosyltransferase [Streptomyces corallincola]MBV2355901.1 nicotinate-nucleotide--dimethylbenzimidazole phosphoribosyltransferase [Streptomyces corallincola]